ncbi:hypothetical protein ASPZODRAFT_132027 [Penicilliopsis zonata CBS 506.65]|uniref:Uncharacterized protein n=1 Tax=Penicilliopsis zonata CBS 506.65 TaxID=1073090 RepID=A0A1L9SJ08_9EURO|nr:hypothetical protein ASPZODRAFT_132027 [Penicilliopsis zonata CBS 506.65]OJJ47091.1 hypothetical protein ASPZODRAFT_132027 [Penicilliopsis zonata CBS 506.65]
MDNHLREERHMALSILTDRELLLRHSLTAHETLPQTRRRFTAKMLSPDDAVAEAQIANERFLVHSRSSSSSTSASSSSAGSSLLSRAVVDVHEMGDAGWRRPDMKSKK